MTPGEKTRIPLIGDVEEGGVHEHEGGESEGQLRPMPADHRAADTQNHDQGVDDVEDGPIDGKLQDRPCPALPVQFVLLQDVQAVGGGGDPQGLFRRHVRS